MHAQSAAAFFKSLSEESSLDEVIGTFGKAYQWELRARKPQSESEIRQLETSIQERMGFRWAGVRRLCGEHESRRKALVLIYAHLLRLPIHNSSIRKGASYYWALTDELNAHLSIPQNKPMYSSRLLYSSAHYSTSRSRAVGSFRPWQ